MHIVLILLIPLCLFLYLALEARKDAEKKWFFVLYALIALFFASSFVYLMFEALTN